MYREYYEKLLRQLAIDYNCTPTDFHAEKDIVTASALREGRRIYSPGKPFLGMVTLGRNTVMMADECLHGFLNDLIRNAEGHRLFEVDHLTRLICNDRCQEAISPDSGFLRDLPTEGISKEPWNQISGIGHSDIRGFGGCRTSTLPTG